MEVASESGETFRTPYIMEEGQVGQEMYLPQSEVPVMLPPHVVIHRDGTVELHLDKTYERSTGWCCLMGVQVHHRYWRLGDGRVQWQCGGDIGER